MNESSIPFPLVYAEMALPAALKRGIQEAGFRQCTPIQAQTLPLALQGLDVAGQAQTGTGKTAAFLIATFHRLLTSPPLAQHKSGQPRALILAPTRELAIQIHKDAVQLGKYTGLKVVVAFGGAGYDSQRAEIEAGLDILIGTPGRLIDYFRQGVFDLRGAQVVVIDEADRMFDLGFIKDIRFLLRRLPKPEQRLSMLFSATLSLRVTELAYEHMNNPRLIKIESEKMTAEKVQELVYYPGNEEKLPLLLGLLKKLAPARSMVFVNTKRVGEEVTEQLRAHAVNAGLLSGDVPQKKRLSLLNRFQQGELLVLVATDVAARGLHIPDVTHVFNYDLPQDAEDYVHRVGRTARAGASGSAISFVCENYAFSLPDIEAYIGHKIAAEKVTPDLLLVPVVAPKQQRPAPSRSAEAARPRRRRRPRSAQGGQR